MHHLEIDLLQISNSNYAIHFLVHVRIWSPAQVRNRINFSKNYNCNNFGPTRFKNMIYCNW